MSRVLIAIGCDDYDHLNKLEGAANDAHSIFNRLIENNRGNFNAEHSSLLISPTYVETRGALTKIFDVHEIDNLTLFYAGHGGVKDGNYFMMCKDSTLDRLSISALSINEIFTWINEKRCKHTNIIIDACKAGGIVHNLDTLLKPEVIGKSDTPSISMLVASTSDQNAKEVNGRGVCTEAILQCIDGDLKVPSLRHTLDLIEVGQVVSENVYKKTKQKPLAWGMSLFGHNPFCKNPEKREEDPVTSAISSIEPKGSSVHIIREHANQLWLEYYEIEHGFDTDRLKRRLSTVTDAIKEDHSTTAEFIENISYTLSQKLKSSHSEFEEAEVLAIGTTILLQYAGQHDQVDNVILQLSNRICDTINYGLRKIVQDMKIQQYHLLSRNSALGDLFYLPLRITKILGWIGVSLLISKYTKCEFDKNTAKEFVQLILQQYCTSIVSVSDTQAPFLSIFLAMREELHVEEEAEVILGLMFNSFLIANGRVAKTNIDPKSILTFLQCKHSNEFPNPQNLVAQPSELLSVFMTSYPMMGLHLEIDECLCELDHSSFNIFTPKSYRDFSQNTITQGWNHTYKIGHDIWRINEFIEQWARISTELQKDSSLEIQTIRLAAAMASLLLPDRTPWFLMPKLKKYPEQTLTK